MAQDIGALLKKYADLRELVGVFASIDCSDPARSMLEQGFAECYDALMVTWISCKERMSDTPRDVWVEPHPFPVEDYGLRFAPIARWDGLDEWCSEGICIRDCRITHWAEMHYPKPPAGDLDKQITEGENECSKHR